MATIKYRELRKRYDMDGAEKTVQHLSEALADGQLKADDFSIRDLAEGLIPGGSRWIRELDPRGSGGAPILEAEGVDLTAFLNISGQVIYSKILEAYHQEAFGVSRMIQTIPTRLDGEKLPGAAMLGDGTTEVAPGMPYPNLGFGEDYIETPNTSKHGLIVPITKEAIFFDRTHLILSRAAEVGEVLAMNKEKRILDMVLGVTKIYKWNGTLYNTCYAVDEPWKNQLESNPLSDITSVENAENLLAAMLDPNTGEPVLVEPNGVIVMPSKRFLAHRLFHSSEVTYEDGNGLRMAACSNPFSSYNVVSSRLALRRLVESGMNESAAQNVWLLGNFRKAFAYMENWPITVTQSAAGSDADFNQDIVVRFKASERGTPAVLNPRYVVKCSP